MVGQHGGHLRRIFTPSLLQPLSHAPVKACPPGIGNLLVQGIAIESVSESVICGDRAVWPLGRSARSDQLRVTHELIETRLDVFQVLLLTGLCQSCQDDGRQKLDTEHARHLQKRSVFIRQSLQPALDERAQSLGDLSEGLGSTVHYPAAIASADGVRLDQVLEKVHHKKGVAVATLVNGFRDVRRALGVDTGAHVSRDVAGRQQLEVEPLEQPPSFELVQHGAEMGSVDSRFSGTVGPDDQQTRGLGSLSNRSQQVQGRRVTPVEILEHEHERVLRGQSFQRIVQLAHHAVQGRALHQTLQPFQLLTFHESRQLQQPHGRVAPEHSDQGASGRFLTKAAERFQHRRVRFAGAVVHHALASSEGRVAPPGKILQEEVDERGLAHARLTSNKDQATFAAIRFEKTVDEVLKLSFAADDRLWPAS